PSPTRNADPRCTVPVAARSRPDGQLPVEPGLGIGDRNVPCERDLGREQPARTPHELAFARREPRADTPRRCRLPNVTVTDDLGEADRIVQLCERLTATLQPRLAAAARRVAQNLLDRRKPGLVDQLTSAFLCQGQRKLHAEAVGQRDHDHRLQFTVDATRLPRLDGAGTVCAVDDDVADGELHHLRGSAATADTSPCSSTETTSRRSPAPVWVNRRTKSRRRRKMTASTAVRVSIR